MANNQNQIYQQGSPEARDKVVATLADSVKNYRLSGQVQELKDSFVKAYRWVLGSSERVTDYLKNWADYALRDVTQADLQFKQQLDINPFADQSPVFETIQSHMAEALLPIYGNNEPKARQGFQQGLTTYAQRVQAQKAKDGIQEQLQLLQQQRQALEGQPGLEDLLIQ